MKNECLTVFRYVITDKKEWFMNEKKMGQNIYLFSLCGLWISSQSSFWDVEELYIRIVMCGWINYQHLQAAMLY